MRKALMGLVVAATALTPIAAFAQDSGRWRGRQEQSETQRAPSRDIQRSWQRYERREQQRQQSQAEQQVRQQRQTSEPAPRVSSRQWDGERSGRTRSFRSRETAPQLAPQQQVQVQERSRDGRDGYRYRRDGDRNWSGERTRTDRNWSDRRAREGDWQRNRSGDWQRNRSGSWSGRTYSWNRDGRRFSWDHDWRSDRRYDWQRYRRSNRYAFNIGPYYSPYRHYGYQRFSIGFFLQPLFFSRNYWISDPWQYRLPYAPAGTRWIRYYDDVLLVDTFTGEVVDVIHNFFW